MVKYYLDTSIWMDLYENRKGFNNELLGNFAWKLLALIKANADKIIITDLLIKELETNYSIEEIKGMLKPFEKDTEKIISTKLQQTEAELISKKRGLPHGDVLHAIIARDYKFVLITRDKHFRQLEDISKHYKPEDLI